MKIVKQLLFLMVQLVVWSSINAQSGNVGIGTSFPNSTLEVVDDTKTRITLNGENSNGVSSLAFKNFQGIDSYQGWLWESDGSIISSPLLSLYDYSYLIGSPTIENKISIYSVYRFNNSYTHQWNGLAFFENFGNPALRTNGAININHSPLANDHPLLVKQKADPGNNSYGLLLINNENDSDNWEFHVTNNGHLNLYADGILTGEFNANSGNYSALSDERAKTNISLMANVLPGISKLSPKKYNYKSNQDKIFNGFLAQELQDEFPEVVSKVPNRGKEGYTYLVDYAQLSVIALKAIQEQQEMIRYQAEQLKILSSRITKLETK